MRQKGYIFTVSAFFLMSSMILLAIFFTSRVLETDVSGPKLVYLYDDIRGDVITLFGMNASISSEDNFTVFTINDIMASNASQLALNNYESYIRANFTSTTRSPGSPAAARIRLGDLENITLLFEPHKYAFNYLDPLKTAVLYYPLENASVLESCSIRLELSDEILNVTESVSQGDLTFTLYASNVSNASLPYEKSFKVSHNLSSEWVIEQESSNITIRVGGAEIGNATVNGTIYAGFWKNPVRTSISLGFGQLAPAYVDSDLFVHISDITSNAEINRTVWFIKE
jgi:hypothetical protein